MGLENPNSHPQLKQFFGKLGLLRHFRRGDKYHFDEEQLKGLKGLHSAIALVRKARKLQRLQNDQLFLQELTGRDGRLHPEYRQLGTHTGRLTSSKPNIMGLQRDLRPVVIPDPGNGIGEADWLKLPHFCGQFTAFESSHI